MMMVPAYGYAPQGQPVMMQRVVMPGAAPAGIPMSFQPPEPTPGPLMANAPSSGPVADSAAQITVVNGQAMVRVVSPDGQIMLFSLGNQVAHEAPVAPQSAGGAREGKTTKSISHQ